jgi:predicted transcriptional regulator of viral defense system
MPPRGSDARRLSPLPGRKLDGLPERAIAELAFRQFGVVRREQLLGLGLTSKQIDGRVERGTLHRVHRGVYAVGHRRLSRNGSLLAAVFGAGRGAVVSHRDAAGLYGIRPANHRQIDLTLPRSRSPLTGTNLHRAALPPSEVTRLQGIPVTTLARTLVDLAGTVPDDHLRRALHEAERVHRNDVREIERIMERTRTRNGRGHAALRAALDDARAHGPRLTRSTWRRSSTA